ARMVADFVPGAMRIDHDYVTVRLEEWQIVVAAVPEHNVGFLLGLPQDTLIIDPGIDHYAAIQMWFIFFAFFDSHVVAIKVVVAGEALDGLPGEIAVGHRMADGDHAVTHLP